MLFTDPEVDLRVPSHARLIADCDGEVREVVQLLAHSLTLPPTMEDYSGGEGNVSWGDDPPPRTERPRRPYRQLYPDDMPWGNPHLEVVRQAFVKILQSNFAPVRTNITKSSTEKTLEMPLRASYYQRKSLYTDPDKHIVILNVGMGKELLHMYQANNNQRLNCHVHMVMHGSRPKTKMRLNWWEGCVQPARLHIHAHDALPTNGDNGQKLVFERVICGLSTGYWFGTDTRRLNLFNWLENHLAPGGEFIGSYVNPDSVKHFEVKTHGRESNLGLVEFRESQKEWVHGSIVVRVDQKTFEDGRIPYDLALRECGARGFTMGTPGLKYMQKYADWEVPSRFKRWVRSAEVTCVDLLYIRRHQLLICDPLPVPANWMPVSSDLPPLGIALSQGGPRMSTWHFPQNHGKILSPSDVMFLRPEDQWLAYKRNGTAGKLIIVDSKARILISHRAGDAVHECPVEFSGSVLAQVEVVVDRVHGFIEKIWVLDVFDCPGLSCSDDFASRYTRGWELLSKFNLPCLVKQEWTPYSPEAFWEMAGTCGRQGNEGVVFQSRRAPRGSFQNHLGSARYWKPRECITVDKAVGNQVFEYYLDGGCVRERTDKKIGNTPGQIAEMESALTVSEIVVLLDNTSHAPEVASAVVDCIVTETLDIPPVVAVALLHPNRSRDSIFTEMIRREVVTTEVEAGHLFARFSGIVEELASDANLALVRKSTRLKWYDPERYAIRAPKEELRLDEFQVVEFDLPEYD